MATLWWALIKFIEASNQKNMFLYVAVLVICLTESTMVPIFNVLNTWNSILSTSQYNAGLNQNATALLLEFFFLGFSFAQFFFSSLIFPCIIFFGIFPTHPTPHHFANGRSIIKLTCPVSKSPSKSSSNKQEVALGKQKMRAACP